MRLGKRELLAEQVPRSRTLRDGESRAVDPVLHTDQLCPEFLDLISDWDPDAANDNYYVTSSDFIELHSQIKRFLIRRIIWWATSVCLGMSVLLFLYR